MLVKTRNGFEMEFMGDDVYLGYGEGTYGVMLEGDKVPEQMLQMRDELQAVLEEYQDRFILCLNGSGVNDTMKDHMEDASFS